jgi:hypothetical protein
MVSSPLISWPCNDVLDDTLKAVKKQKKVFAIAMGINFSFNLSCKYRSRTILKELLMTPGDKDVQVLLLVEFAM